MRPLVLLAQLQAIMKIPEVLHLQLQMIMTRPLVLLSQLQANVTHAIDILDRIVQQLRKKVSVKTTTAIPLVTSGIGEDQHQAVVDVGAANPLQVSKITSWSSD